MKYRARRTARSLVPLARELLDWCLPRVCGGCDANPPVGRVLCPRCHRAVAWCEPGEALELDAQLIEAGVAAAAYEGVVEVWVRRFKYPGRGLFELQPGPAAATAALIEAALQGLAVLAPECPSAVDAVVPVPSAPARVRERGFHPAGNLARVAAAALRKPVAWEALRTTELRPSQTGLTRAERRRNAAGAFEAARGFRGAALLLIDDVVTTGATVESAARALRRSGAARVWVACAARAPRTQRG